MRSSNPVLTGRGFARIKESTTTSGDLNTLENRPTSAPMSIDDVVIKTAGLFAVLVAVGAFAWRANSPGLALGTISAIFEATYAGIVSQAVLGTACAFGGVLLAYRSGKIRVTPKFTRIMLGAMMGYLVFSLITLFTGRPGGATGLLVAVAAVALATFFLVLDFDQIERTIAAGAPQEESWRMAFGLMVTIVWLYLEVLRLLSILRNND